MFKIDFRRNKTAWVMMFLGLCTLLFIFVLSVTHGKTTDSIIFAFMSIIVCILMIYKPDNLLDSLVLTDDELQLTYYKKSRKQTRVIKKSDIQSINIKVKPYISPRQGDACCFSVTTNDEEKLELNYCDRYCGICHAAEFFKIKDSLPNFTFEVDTESSYITKDEYFKYVNSVLENEKQAKERK